MAETWAIIIGLPSGFAIGSLLLWLRTERRQGAALVWGSTYVGAVVLTLLVAEGWALLTLWVTLGALVGSSKLDSWFGTSAHVQSGPGPS